jgi:hypothetical protein
VALWTTLAAFAPARADLGPLEPIADAHRALHDALGLPEPMIVRLLERGLPEPELPALGLIAQQAHVPVARVADLRLSGLPWVDVARRVGSGPEIFYVPYAADPGPPYGKAWGYYRKTPRAQWRTIRLADADVIRSSNVLLLHRYYSVPVARVVELQRGGRSFAAIHHQLWTDKHPAKSAKGAKAGKGAGPHGAAVKGAGAAHGTGKPQAAKAAKAHPKSSKSKPPKSHGNSHDR